MKPLFPTLIPVHGRKDSILQSSDPPIDRVGREGKLELALAEKMIAAESLWQCVSDEKETRERLKEQYVECLGRAAAEFASLRRAIHALIEWGVSRRDLVQWAVEAGYSTGYVRSLVSRILEDPGLRCRKPGAVRKIPREALALRALAQKHYPEQARKFLLAYRTDNADLSGAAHGTRQLEDIQVKAREPRDHPIV